jgi:hypothetical protein
MDEEQGFAASAFEVVNRVVSVAEKGHRTNSSEDKASNLED